MPRRRRRAWDSRGAGRRGSRPGCERLGAEPSTPTLRRGLSGHPEGVSEIQHASDAAESVDAGPDARSEKGKGRLERRLPIWSTPTQCIPSATNEREASPWRAERSGARSLASNAAKWANVAALYLLCQSWRRRWCRPMIVPNANEPLEIAVCGSDPILHALPSDAPRRPTLSVECTRRKNLAPGCECAGRTSPHESEHRRRQAGAPCACRSSRPSPSRRTLRPTDMTCRAIKLTLPSADSLGGSRSPAQTSYAGRRPHGGRDAVGPARRCPATGDARWISRETHAGPHLKRRCALPEGQRRRAGDGGRGPR